MWCINFWMPLVLKHMQEVGMILFQCTEVTVLLSRTHTLHLQVGSATQERLRSLEGNFLFFFSIHSVWLRCSPLFMGPELHGLSCSSLLLVCTGNPTCLVSQADIVPVQMQFTQCIKYLFCVIPEFSEKAVITGTNPTASLSLINCGTFDSTAPAFLACAENISCLKHKTVT